MRPSRDAFKAMYERGYLTWASLREATSGPHLRGYVHGLIDPSRMLHRHPHFPPGLRVDLSLSNAVMVRGRTRWKTTRGLCDLPSFQEEVMITVATSSPTPIVFSYDSSPCSRLLDTLSGEGNHITVLMLAWAYVLSARWVDLLPGAHMSQDKTNLDNAEASQAQNPSHDRCIVDVGDVDETAVEWWRAVLAANGSWEASIRTRTGNALCSPWSIKARNRSSFAVVGGSKTSSCRSDQRPPTFDTAMGYLLAYCHRHNLNRQCELAFAAVLLLPVAKYDNKRVSLPISRALHRSPDSSQPRPFMDGNSRCLDQLLTLSCNARGVKSILNSVFFEHDVDCNIYGAWLQGSLSFLDTEKARDRPSLLYTLVKRDPRLAFLWTGAFITGADTKCLQEARLGWWKVDLNAAAWTETLVSFIQQGTSVTTPERSCVSRADECRLMYLAHNPDHANPPLFPMRPFGYTAIEDVDLDVRQHAQCGSAHRLEYVSFTWVCEGGNHVEQGTKNISESTLMPLEEVQSLDYRACSVDIDYEGLDYEDEISEMVTRNVFTWLRGEDGFPVAERAIREHEWIDNLQSDDDAPIEGDTLSSFGGRNSGQWLLKVSTHRSNSF